MSSCICNGSNCAKTFEEDEFSVPVKDFSKINSPYDTTNPCSSSITIVESSYDNH